MLRKLVSLAFSAAVVTMSASNYTQYVDPFIGTGPVNGGLSGNNYPGPTMPFGMVQLSPDTHPAPFYDKASGYCYNDSKIYGFSHTHLSGTGVADLLDITLMPTTDSRAVSNFTHEEEEARPGYYRVLLTDEGVNAELSATTRAGIHRYTYPSGSDRKLWIDLDHSAIKGDWDRKVIQAQIKQISPTRVVGFRLITGWAKARKIYFVAEFSEPIENIAFYDGDNLKYAEGESGIINSNAPRALISFGNKRGSVVAKVALSPVSIDNAKENLEAEASSFDFDSYVAAADKAWEDKLEKIEVRGNPEQMKTFYTALYHTMIQPNTFSDVNGQWMTPDFSTAALPKGEVQYTTFSLWDTFRGVHPLYTIINPELTRDCVNSMLRHYDFYGYLPIWELWGQENYCMIGNHAIPVVVDAVLKGIPGIDVDKAWKAVEGSSITSHLNSPFTVWEKYGYMPENIQTQSVSITLEMAYDDWCSARLAERVGDKVATARFDSRAQNYKNLHNGEFFAPKDDQGNWITPFDPLKHGANGGNPFTEGNAWQYYWFVPQDIPSLVALTGGSKSFERKLDEFFSLDNTPSERNSNVSGCIGQYAHGNEPSHHVAYLYNYAGKPEKTRSMIRRIMKEMYTNDFNGYAGNDDCGEMSVWYVFSAMGFYPVNPASGVYDIGLPLFDSCTIHLPSGKDFTINATKRVDAESSKVKKILLNGKPLKDLKLSHSDIVNGGTLDFCFN